MEDDDDNDESFPDVRRVEDKIKEWNGRENERGEVDERRNGGGGGEKMGEKEGDCE